MPPDSLQRSITAAATLYGHLVGLSLERGDLKYSKAFPGKMYARFEYLDQTTTYLVPDWELFTILANHLCNNAQNRAQSGNYEFARLWIKNTDAGWSVYVSEIGD